MDRERLRALQEPLKDRYREDPGAALVTLRATGTLGDGISCSISTGRALAEAGLHPASGGDGTNLCSGDMLLEALVACAGVTLRSVATAMGMQIRSGQVRAEGLFDARGTLGVDRSVPVGLQDVVVTFEVDTDADEAALQRLAVATERYCVVGQSLATPPRFEVHRAALR